LKAELIVDSQCGVGESPVWSAKEQALYWVDIPGKKLQRWDAASGQTTVWNCPEMLACIAPTAEPGEWIAGMETGVFMLRPAADLTLKPEAIVKVEHAAPGMRFNDGRCDRRGRFLAGTMVGNMALGSDAGRLYSHEASSIGSTLSTGVTSREVLGGLITPNGLAFSPDGRTMYLSDSHPTVQLIWAFDYDGDTGTPTNRRVWVDMKSLPGRPDGAAIDEDGCYWICANDAGMVHRFTPRGELDQSISLPVKKPAMCAFGGADMDTLFVTSIRPSGVDLSDQPHAGGLFAVRLNVRGIAESVFGA
jgi:sugar lactone lactonase YvrE